jgi:hemolysin III
LRSTRGTGLERLDVQPIALIGAGGVLYTLGAVIYSRQRPDPWPQTFAFHEVFHGLVIGAAACQFAAIAGWIVT